MQPKVNLSAFDGSDFEKGAGTLKTIFWYLINAFFVRASWNPLMKPKIWLLRMFGAKIGKGICLKNNVTIKSPWNLMVGDNCWIGENVWIDNIDKVSIGSNVCISQGALLLTGNHDYKKPAMPYRNAPITIEDGAWIGANTTVCAGVTVHENAILTAGSMTSRDLDANCIYQGVPSVKVRERVMES